jgi:hypothetical protein
MATCGCEWSWVKEVQISHLRKQSQFIRMGRAGVGTTSPAEQERTPCEETPDGVTTNGAAAQNKANCGRAKVAASI